MRPYLIRRSRKGFKTHALIHISSAAHVPFILIKDVVTPRADTHWGATQYGAVDLTGLSLDERDKKKRVCFQKMLR